MASASNGFEAKLRDVGNRLLHPPSSADELVPLLEVTLMLYISIYAGGTINFCVWHGVFNLSLLIYKVIVSYAFSFSIKCLLSGSCFYPTEFVDIFFFSSVELIAY